MRIDQQGAPDQCVSFPIKALLVSLCVDNVPAEMWEPLYKDQYDQEHLKPSISKLLVAPETYCRAHALLTQVDGAPAPPPQGSPGDAEALLQLLEKKGLSPKVQDVDVTPEDLSCIPVRMVGGSGAFRPAFAGTRLNPPSCRPCRTPTSP